MLKLWSKFINCGYVNVECYICVKVLWNFKVFNKDD